MTMPDHNAARVAVYVLPAGAFGAAGASWLGWDAARGVPVTQPVLPDLPRPLAGLTGTARRYGFHATIKPPMRLVDGATVDDVAALLAPIAARMAIGSCDMNLAIIAGFLAFLPDDPQPLCDLAATVVRDLDPLRAPLTQAEIARRKPATLSARQTELLHSFGYPYVMDQFQPHLTLTDHLAPPEQAAVTAAARRHFAGTVPAPCHLDTLAVMVEGADGFFRLHRRVTLAGG